MSFRELVALLVATQEEIYRRTGKNRVMTLTVSREDFVAYWKEHRNDIMPPYSYTTEFQVAPDVWISSTWSTL